MQTVTMIVVGIAALLFVMRIVSREEFTGSRPRYCKKRASCLGQGCSLSPSNQKCSRTRTVAQVIDASDPNWGEILGGETVQVCAASDGKTPIDPDTCSECSVCGTVYPPTGLDSASLCLPLDSNGCLQNAPSDKLLAYLNKNPSSISCCGN
jgi:hypothetical protein